MAEPYIKLLERQKAELIEAYKAVIEWHEALEYAHRAVYKADAFKAAEAKKAEMDAKRKIIEPYMAEKE